MKRLSKESIERVSAYQPGKPIEELEREYGIEEAGPGGSLAVETELDPSLTKADALSGCIASHTGKLPEISEDIKIKFKLFKEVFGTGKHEAVGGLKPSELLMLSLNTTIII